MSKKTNPNDIVAYRRREKRAAALPKLIIACAVIAVLVLVALNASKIVAPLEGIADNFEVTKRGPAGYPVKLPGSAGYRFYPYDDGFVLLTDTYLYAYAGDGAQIYAAQHGYANPHAIAGNKRVLAYDRNNRSFALYGKKGEAFRNSTEEKIVYATVGEEDSSAVVLKGTGYSNILEVYDGKGQWRYRRRFVDENIAQAAFVNSDTEIVVATIGFDSGDGTAKVYKFTTESEDDLVWEFALPENSLPLALYADPENAVVLCDKQVFVLNAADGSQKGSYGFVGDVADYAFSAQTRALVIDDFAEGAVMLVTLDDSANVIARIAVTATPEQIGVYDGEIVVLDATGITSYLPDLTQTDYIPLGDEYSGFIKINGEFLLLGYEKIEKAVIPDTELPE